MKRCRSVAVVLASSVCAALPSGASAQMIVLSDDFETGDLSRWSRVVQAPSGSIAATPAAAFRGSYGMRVVDADGGTGRDSESYVSFSLPQSGGDLRLEFKMRVSASNDAGDVLPAEIMMLLSGDTVSAASFGLLPAAGIQLSGHDARRNFTSRGMGPGLGGGWNDVAVVASGMGTTAGRRELWINGELRIEQQVDWDGASFSHVKLGEPWGSTSWEGVLEFDDVSVRWWADGGSGGADAGMGDGGGGADGGPPDAGAGGGQGGAGGGGGSAGVEGQLTGPEVLRVGCGCSAGASALLLLPLALTALRGRSGRSRACSSGR